MDISTDISAVFLPTPSEPLFPVSTLGLCPLKVLVHVGCPQRCCCRRSLTQPTPKRGRAGRGVRNPVQAPWGRLS